MSWFVALIVGAVGAWIAFLQWVTAREKLNHDLFDRRFAVFKATQDYLVTCLNSDGGTTDDTSAFYQATRPAPFLFDKEINDFLLEVMKFSINVQVFGKDTGNTALPEHQSYLDLYHKSQLWIAEAHGNITAKFQPSMNLSNIGPFSRKDIVPIPDVQMLREKITSALKLNP